MLDKFYYQNNFGEKLYFGQDGLFASYNDLRDYQWSYTAENNVIGEFARGTSTKSLPCIFLSDDAKTTRELRNKAYSIVEKDIISGKKGKLYLNDFFMECYVYGMTNSEYLKSQKYLKTTFLVCTDRPCWIKENTFQFKVTSNNSSQYDVDFPFDFPFDFKSDLVGNVLTNDNNFDSDFVLVIFGPCQNPHITIGDCDYSFNCVLLENEYLEVNSSEKTIYKYGVDNAKENLFNSRNKEKSVFAKIPIGNKQVAWNNKFNFNLTVIKEHSEPEWDYKIASVDDVGSIEVVENTYYLLDSAGEYIKDSNDVPITLESGGEK